MDDEELRWTVRLFADCLPPEQRAACLGAYEERWPIEERRAFVAAFVPRYTALALAALDRAEAAGADSLASLTDEDLQGMSLAEKWTLLAQGPDGCRPDQLRRELARLFMCKSYDLFHDAGLSEAAVEYPAYHRVREALEAQPDTVIADLVGLVVGHGARLRSRVPHEVEAALLHIRDGLSQRLGIVITPDRLFAGQMLRLPLDHPDQVVEVAAPGLTRALGLAGVDLRTAFLVLADLMTQGEVEEHLLPVAVSIVRSPRCRFRSFAAASRLWGLLGDRRLTDFAERYRSGRMIADRKWPPRSGDSCPTRNN